MNYTAEEVRARFEAWAEENGYDVLRIEPDYNDGFTAAAWHGYQAAYAERIKADESTMPAATSCADHAKGETGYCTFHTQVSWGTKLFAHPPAQAVQVDAFADRLRQSIMRDTFQPTADPVARGEASLGRCKACGRATRAVCDGLDGNGLGCTNAPPIDLDAVRKVIAHLRQFDSPYTRGLADKLEAAIKGEPS